MDSRFHILDQQGTSQTTKVLESLDPSSVEIEGRSVDDLLQFVRKISPLVNYYGPDNETVEGWGFFFRKTDIVIISHMANVDLDKLSANYKIAIDLIRHVTPEEIDPQILVLFHDELIRSVNMVKSWYDDLSDEDYADTLSQILMNVMKVEFPSYVASLNEIYAKVPKTDIEELQWPDGPPYTTEGKALEVINISRPDGCAILMSAIHDKLYHEISTIRQVAVQQMEMYSHKFGKVRPDLALLLSFLRLNDLVRDELNRLPTRHLEFYYRTVLNQKEADFEHGEAHLWIESKRGFTDVHVPAGTPFRAGKDKNGQKILYDSQQELVLSSAKIAAISTLFSSRNSKVLPCGALNMITNLYSREMTVEELELPTRWAITGEDQYGKSTRNRTMADSLQGFAISSAELLLGQGLRSIELQFEFTDKDLQTWKRKGEELADASEKKTINQLLEWAFDITVTGESGLMKVDRAVTMATDKGFQISFEIPSMSEALIGFDPEIHGNRIQSSLPTVFVTYNRDSAILVYSLLENLQFNRIWINTRVAGMEKLDLYNSEGIVAIDKPYPVFGSLPKAGDYFGFGVRELYAKNLRWLELTLEWQSLPEEGFLEYFKDYNPPEDLSYLFGLEEIKGRVWRDSRAEPSTGPLFVETKQETSAYDHSNKLRFQFIKGSEFLDLPNQTASDDEEAELVEQYRLKLECPKLAFGHADYANVLANKMLEAAKSRKKDAELTVNPPWTPKLERATLSYESSHAIVEAAPTQTNHPGNANVFQLHAFGYKSILIGNKLTEAIVPTMEFESALHIGFDGLKPGSVLNLYFELSDGNASTKLGQATTIHWSFLKENDWKPIRENMVISDSTRNLTQSGIIQLHIPKEIDLTHTILENGLAWLRLSTLSNSHLLSKCLGIYVNGIMCQWSGTEGQVLDKTPVAAGAIAKCDISIEGLGAINQPFAGKIHGVKEDVEQFRTRVASQLRHKGRASTHWDVEHLILNEFPFVNKVKCFNADRKSEFFNPGTIDIVVVPDIVGYSVSNRWRPKFSATILSDIRDFVSAVSSPFVKVNVRNPFYERIRVACKVKFTNPALSSQYVKRLSDEIDDFLIPWVSDSEEEEQIGISVFKSDLLGFVENRNYVDFVTSFSVFKTADKDGHYELEDSARSEEPSAVSGSDETNEDYTDSPDAEVESDDGKVSSNDDENQDVPPSEDADESHNSELDADDHTHHDINPGEEISPLYPWSILTSGGAHQIEPIDDTIYSPAEPRGIGNMEIQTDFITIEVEKICH